MSEHERLKRLTRLLYGLSAVMFGAMILELLAARHDEEPAQLIPFALCAAVIVVISLAGSFRAWTAQSSPRPS